MIDLYILYATMLVVVVSEIMTVCWVANKLTELKDLIGKCNQVKKHVHSSRDKAKKLL